MTSQTELPGVAELPGWLREHLLLRFGWRRPSEYAAMLRVERRS